jgi:hypothetical protein
VPVTTGCYLGTYWITAEHWDDQWSWLGVAVSRLREAGRMFEERTHVHTAFYDFIGEVRRGDDGPRGFQALNHPYAGLVLEILDVHDGSIDSAVDWVTREHVPAVLRGSPMGLCTVFAPHPWPAGQYWFENAAVPAGRLALLWFLDEDPRESWADTFAVEPARVGGTGIATMSFLAPFIPTIPGTDRYVDELR